MTDTTQLQYIGKMIKEFREYREMSQKELAEAAGIRIATLSDIENGKANFQINTIVSLANVLDCFIDISLTPMEVGEEE